jgi:hypothetical protein
VNLNGTLLISEVKKAVKDSVQQKLMWAKSVPIVGYWSRTRQGQSGSHGLALLMKWGCPLDVLLSGQGEPRVGVESSMHRSGWPGEHLSIGGEHAPHYHCFEMKCNGCDVVDAQSLATRFRHMTGLLCASVCVHRCWDAEPGDPVGQKSAGGASILPGEVLLPTTITCGHQGLWEWSHNVYMHMVERAGGSSWSWCKIAVLIPGCDDIPCQATRKEIRLQLTRLPGDARP